MRVHDLAIDNFNGFARRTFIFNAGFNLLVGDNGTGKTSLLDALAVSIGSWFLGLRGYESSRGIDPDEVRVAVHPHGDMFTFEKQFPARITCSGVVMGRQIRWTRELHREGGRTTTRDAKAIVEAAREAERCVRAGQLVTLPLICAYGTERLWFEKGHRAPTSEKSAGRKPSRFDGYRDCFNFTIQESDLINWIRDEAVVSGQLKKDTVALSVVKAAVARCVEGAASLYYDARYKDVVVVGPQSEYQLFRNLSDGHRIMLTLIGDLASRAVKLNPHLAEAVLRETPGVVLIDELDLHLHPKWQRRVIGDLKATFPALQFIATSHSPQLIGEARPEELMLLDESGTTLPPRSFGVDSSRILEEVMGATSRDPSTQDLLRRLFHEIDEERFETARSLLDQAEAALGPDDPEITRARALMTFLEAKI